MTFSQLSVGSRFKVTEEFLSRTGAIGMRDMVFEKVRDTHAEIVGGPKMIGEHRHFRPDSEVESVSR